MDQISIGWAPTVALGSDNLALGLDNLEQQSKIKQYSVFYFYSVGTVLGSDIHGLDSHSRP